MQHADAAGQPRDVLLTPAIPVAVIIPFGSSCCSFLCGGVARKWQQQYCGAHTGQEDACLLRHGATFGPTLAADPTQPAPGVCVREVVPVFPGRWEMWLVAVQQALLACLLACIAGTECPHGGALVVLRRPHRGAVFSNKVLAQACGMHVCSWVQLHAMGPGRKCTTASLLHPGCLVWCVMVLQLCCRG